MRKISLLRAESLTSTGASERKLPLLSIPSFGLPTTHILGVENFAATEKILSTPVGLWVGLEFLVPGFIEMLSGCLIWYDG